MNTKTKWIALGVIAIIITGITLYATKPEYFQGAVRVRPAPVVTCIKKDPVTQTTVNSSSTKAEVRFAVKSTRNISIHGFELRIFQKKWDNINMAMQGAVASNDLDAPTSFTDNSNIVRFQTDVDDNNLAVGDTVELGIATSTDVNNRGAGAYYADITSVPSDTSTSDIEGNVIYETLSPTTLGLAGISWNDDARANNVIEVLDHYLKNRIERIEIIDPVTENVLAVTNYPARYQFLPQQHDINTNESREFVVRLDLSPPLPPNNSFIIGIRPGNIVDRNTGELIRSSEIEGLKPGMIYGPKISITN